MVTINLLQAYELLALQEELTNEEILQQAKDKEAGDWSDLISEWPMEEAIKLSEQPEVLKEALAGNYTISYITMPGLINLLQKRFGLQQDKDFTVTNTAIERLALTKDMADAIKKMLSTNWSLHQQDSFYTISM
ncbi:MAG TPA: hypothetical protein K8V30_04775 [Metalysinibacillus jejuensis]|uniref:Uncharacterized protein n=1 Tax=Metalysinibacillus jejuensis TaxID=914327 RepID=A0A921NBD8_9BACL|nr:hypothetical protein [Metalysinibacillus jejuensis]HJH11002.1 hypothetical protein [Metalysinibacillus jejuensis]